MRILYLHQYYHTPKEGGGVRSYHVAKAMAAAGHQVHVVTTWSRPMRKVVRDNGLLITYLPIAYSNHMPAMQRIKAFLRFVWGSYQVAKVWLPAGQVFATSTPLTVGLTALMLKIFHDVPYVFEVRDPWPEAPIQLGYVKNPLYREFLRRLERGIYGGARKLVALSPPMQTHVETRAPGKEVGLISNFADTAFYGPEAKQLRVEEAGDFHIVYTGSFGYANQVSRLLELALSGRQANLPVRFTLAGEGAELEETKAFIRKHDLGYSVTLLPHQSNHAVRALLATADAAYVGFRPEPVLQGNSPNKFFDALAASVPILLGMQGWLAEEVRRSGCGIVLADYASDLEGLKALMSSDNRKMRQAAGELASRYDKDRLVNNLVETIVT